MRKLLLLFSTFVLAGACARPDATQATPRVVNVAAADFAFGMPDTVPAGLTTFRLANNGQEPHHMVVVRLAEGKTMADFQAAAMDNKTPDWMSFPGSPGVVMSGDTATTTAALEPGQYVAICFIPSPDGTPHVAKGMVRPFVVAGDPVAAVEPAADLTVRLSDYAFQFSDSLTAGTHVIRVENAGPQLHEIVFERLSDGKTLQDYVAWEKGGMQGPPPSAPVGGLVGPTKGGRAYLSITLPPGKYLLVCHVPDESDGRSHIQHGMIQEITIS
jgi:hypothetical protein